MSERPDRFGSGRGGGVSRSEEPIEIRRYLDALRRGRWLIAAVVVVLAGAVLAASVSLPKQYKATASIVKRVTTGPYESVNVDSLTRELNTIDKLLTTTDVLHSAASKVPGETVGSLSGKVQSSVDPDANLILVTATDDQPARAAQIANAVASTFVTEQRDVTRQQYAAARAGLLQELERVRGQPGAATQEQAITQRLSELGVSLASAGTDLVVAQQATVPSSPDSPRPLRNTILAVFLGLFLGVLIVLARDQLVPRVSGARELSHVLELPLLASVPYVGRRLGRRTRMQTGIEYETYQTLATAVRFALPPDEGPHVIVVTSAIHAEGKSTVTARLGRALAQAGHATLLVSADLRWPTLHELVEIPLGPGLMDALVDERAADPAGIERLAQPVGAQRRGTLHAIASGQQPGDPAELFSRPAFERVMASLHELDYSYVLIDAPPLLGIADAQALARRADALLYVARLDRITLDNVADARDVLDRLDVNGLGVVAIGARSEASPYYLAGRAPAYEDA